MALFKSLIRKGRSLSDHGCGDPSGDRWIHEPDAAEAEIERLLNDLYLDALVDETPSVANAFVSGIG